MPIILLLLIILSKKLIIAVIAMGFDYMQVLIS